MLKFLFLIHRYLGIGLGLLMVLWCLSGFVMMYKSYPELSDQERLALLPPLQLADCCQVPAATSLGEWRFEAFQLQMLGPFPVLHLDTEDGRLVTIDLRHDRVFHSIPDRFADQLAAGFATRHDYPGASPLGSIHNDQWTVYGAYNPHRPLYHYAAEDDAGTEWYLSSRTGEVIQLTTRDERVWGFLGAVIHWLYPTLLREKVQLWSQVVIWLTVAGILLTATGIYFGLRQYRQRNNGRRIPYRGASRWHHFAGLVFGFFTFTWMLSGLFSMQPWGLMEGEGPAREQAMLRGGTLAWAQISEVLPRLGDLRLPPGSVRLEGRLLQGELALYGIDADGGKTRFDAASLAPSALPDSRFMALAAILSPSGAGAVERIELEDAYYYHHHESVQLPAWRVIANDGWQTRYYLDPASGDILKRVDTESRFYRWLHYGLHRGDFTRLLRSRPVWDVFVGLLMAGVTLGAMTGLWIGCRRLGLVRKKKLIVNRLEPDCYQL